LGEEKIPVRFLFTLLPPFISSLIFFTYLMAKGRVENSLKAVLYSTLCLCPLRLALGGEVIRGLGLIKPRFLSDRCVHRLALGERRNSLSSTWVDSYALAV
jgi:hypothetical protein